MAFSEFWKTKVALQGALRTEVLRELYLAYKERRLATHMTEDDFYLKICDTPISSERDVETFDLYTAFGVSNFIEFTDPRTMYPSDEIFFRFLEWDNHIADPRREPAQTFGDKEAFLRKCDLDEEIFTRDYRLFLDWAWTKYRELSGCEYISLGAAGIPAGDQPGENGNFSFTASWTTHIIDLTLKPPQHGGTYPDGIADVYVFLQYGLGMVDDPVYWVCKHELIPVYNSAGSARIAFEDGFNGYVIVQMRPAWNDDVNSNMGG